MNYRWIQQRRRFEQRAESMRDEKRQWRPASAEKRLRPERGAKSPSESERGWGPASAEKCGLFAGIVAFLLIVLSAAAVAQSGSKPSRIISVIPAVTEMLFAVGAGDQVAAVGSFDRYPPEIEKLPRVGALLDPDLEKILSLRPDLVAIYDSQKDLRQQLERAQVPVFAYRHAALADVSETIRQLGDRVGRQAEAARAVAVIQEGLEDVRRRVAGRPRPKVLLVFGREAGTLRGMYASGGYGFLHDLLEVAGGDNVFADVKRQSVQASTELVLARRPEVIVELRGASVDERAKQTLIAEWNAVPAVPAVRTKRIHVIADDRTVIPGPRVAESARLIGAALHPEGFK